MAHIGRPRVGDRISVRLTDEVLSEIDTRAASAGVSRAEAIRVLLERGLGTGRDDGVDRTQIARRLDMTPAERVRTMAEETRRLVALAGRAG